MGKQAIAIVLIGCESERVSVCGCSLAEDLGRTLFCVSSGWQMTNAVSTFSQPTDPAPKPASSAVNTWNSVPMH